MEEKNEILAKEETKKLTLSMKEKLSKYEKVTIKVPIDKQNLGSKFVTVQINGYTYQIQRGVEVKVPTPVKKLLERAKYI
ncbi:MAG: hypothetical protein IJW82_07520 [Clostridia bacterium]|nr:hypothetical protein [Clostridia bacterium]